jgi:hypothetical protein
VHLAITVGGAEKVDPGKRAAAQEYWFRRRGPPATAIMKR